ncbi:electron transport complex protein RnfC [Deltaproteobacteria bacterium Smac51]|nr:electron transport complex protein RnfC [Deltaproteobacteria bacterium Smac51]
MDDILNKIREAGIVGAGGAGFPTAIKLKAAPEFVVVNGAECEPLLKVDQQLAETHAATLMNVLNTLVREMGAKAGIFALKEKYKTATAALKKEAEAYPALSVKTLGNYYPMGDEQVLVYEVTGRIVPEGGIPLACGVVVINVETLLNVALAIDHDQPVIEKYVTVAGAVRKPATFKVPVGVSYAELIEAAGGATVPDPVLINGGPMMGKVECDLNTPVTKTSKGIIVLNRDHAWVLSKNRSIEEMMRISKTACCHCQLCTDLCPRYLLGHKLHPDKLIRLASYNTTAEKEEPATGAFLCCECALCELACIMRLQPWKLNQQLKQRMGALGIKNPHHEQPKDVNRFRAWRQFPIPKLIHMVGLADYEHQDAPLTDYPGRVTEINLPLKQHLGAPCVPTVSAGDEVSAGQLVAAPAEGAMGANIHASIGGRVKSVDQGRIVIG